MRLGSAFLQAPARPPTNRAVDVYVDVYLAFPGRFTGMIEKRKFSTDAIAGFVSIAILGISGLLINVLIAHHYNAAVLGAFNQVFAIYILGSQLGTLGVQFSVLKYSAEYSSQKEELQALFLTGLMIVVASSLVVLRASRSCCGILFQT